MFISVVQQIYIMQATNVSHSNFKFSNNHIKKINITWHWFLRGLNEKCNLLTHLFHDYLQFLLHFDEMKISGLEKGGKSQSGRC